MKGFIFKLIFSILLVLIVGALGYLGWKKITKIQTEKLHTTISRTLSQSAELILYKMQYTDVIAIKKQTALGLAKSYSIVKFSGIIRIGIKNFDDIKYNISEDKKSINLTIPKTELLGNEIISQKVFDDKKSIFIPIQTQEIFNEIDSAKDEAVKEILEEGILDEADERAKTYIKQMMQNLGFETITIN